MSENVQMPQQGVIIANILPTLSGMPQKLEEHKFRVARASAAADTLITEVEGTEEITAEQDERLKSLIIRMDDADKVMKTERQPFTQMMAEIAAMFTGNEGQLKVKRDKCQELRNKRANQVAYKERERQKEEQRKADKARERADIVAFITRNIEMKLSAKKADRKSQLLKAFEDITLANFDEKEKGMRSLMHDFPFARLNDILNYFVPAQKLHTPEEVAAINNKIREDYDWDTFGDKYKAELGEFMQDLIDRLPSKKDELLEKKRQAEEAERLRIQKEEQLKKEQQLRQQQEHANAQERERLRLQQEQLKREQEETQRREAQQRAEKERIEREQREREEAQRLELEVQRQREQERADQQAEAARATSHAATLFDQVSTAAPAEKKAETRMSYDIEVTGAAGYVELFQFWFMEEGAALWEKDKEKFKKMTFAKLVSFAEGKKKKGKTIDSKHIIYKESHTAVNRREKEDDNGN